MDKLNLFSFLLFFLVVGLNSPSQLRGKRHPASTGGQCFPQMAVLIEEQNPRSKMALWRRLLSLPSQDFNEDLYRAHLRDLEPLEGDHFRPLSDSPEGILAFIKASGDRVGMELEVDPARWSRFKRGHFEKVIEQLKKRGRLNLSSLDELTGELFVAAYGPRLKWRHFFRGDLARERIIQRVVYEDLVKKGLLKTFKDYRMPDNFLQKFYQTPWAKGLATTLFNLPVLAGLPPLYLPAVKKPVISEALSREILENGLTDNIVAKIELELGASFKTKEQYEKLRKAYMAGIMVYLTYAGVYDAYQLNKAIDEENEDLKESIEAGQEITADLEVLEEENINVFEENSYQEGSTFCEAISECLAEVGDRELCVSLMDPDSRCKSE